MIDILLVIDTILKMYGLVPTRREYARLTAGLQDKAYLLDRVKMIDLICRRFEDFQLRRRRAA